MTSLKNLILISLLAFNCLAIEKTDALGHRMLVVDDEVVDIVHPDIETCIKPMRDVLQDKEGIKTTLVNVDEGDDYLLVNFPLNQDLSGCEGTVTYNMFFMNIPQALVDSKKAYHAIDDFGSRLQDSSLFSTSTEGPAKFYWNFKVPLKIIDEYRKSNFWPQTNTGKDVWSTMIYLGLNVNHAVLKETFIFTQVKIEMQVVTESQVVSLVEDGFTFRAVELENLYKCSPEEACVVTDKGGILNIQLVPADFSTTNRVRAEYDVFSTIFMLVTIDESSSDQFKSRQIKCYEDSATITYSDSLMRTHKMPLKESAFDFKYAQRKVVGQKDQASLQITIDVLPLPEGRVNLAFTCNFTELNTDGKEVLIAAEGQYSDYYIKDRKMKRIDTEGALRRILPETTPALLVNAESPSFIVSEEKLPPVDESGLLTTPEGGEGLNDDSSALTSMMSAGLLAFVLNMLRN